MKARCLNPRHKSYRNYGGRGIVVCDRWLNFDNFLDDMGEKPEGLTLDRIDNDGNYEPGNVRWATRFEQMRNTRVNRRYLINGESLTLVEILERNGLTKHFSVMDTRIRYKGWSIERALKTPVATHRILDKYTDLPISKHTRYRLRRKGLA
jgi:hypothetical protein